MRTTQFAVAVALFLALSAAGRGDGPPPTPPGAKKLADDPIELRDLCRSAGACYARATMRFDDPNEFSAVRYDITVCVTLGDKLGFTLDKLPAPPKKAGTTEWAEKAVAFLFDGKRNTMPKQIGKKWGAEYERLCYWAMVLEVVDEARVPGRLSNRTLRDLVTTHSVDAGLPKELGTPILDELKKEKPNLRAAGMRAWDRTSFYVHDVLTKKADVSELADPEFDSKLVARRKEAARTAAETKLAKALKGADTPERATEVLVELIDKPYEDDELDIIGKKLRDLGPRAVPTLCRWLSLPASAKPAERFLSRAAGVALDMVLYQKTLQEARQGVARDVRKKWDGTCLPELVACLSSAETQLGALDVLVRLSLETGGRPVTGARDLRKTADEKMRPVIDALLNALAAAHIEHAFGAIEEAARRGAVPAAAFRADLEVVRSVGDIGTGTVRAAARRFEAEDEEGGATTDGKRAFLEGIGALKPIPPEVKAERVKAVAVWTAAAAKIDTTKGVYTLWTKAITKADIKIGQYEQLLGERVTRTYKISGAPALLDVVMRENAEAAGRFAMNQAIRADLKEVLDARQFAVREFVSALEAEVSASLNAEDRELLRRHGLLKSVKLPTDPVPKK